MIKLVPTLLVDPVDQLLGSPNPIRDLIPGLGQILLGFRHAIIGQAKPDQTSGEAKKVEADCCFDDRILAVFVTLPVESLTDHPVQIDVTGEVVVPLGRLPEGGYLGVQKPVVPDPTAVLHHDVAVLGPGQQDHHVDRQQLVGNLGIVPHQPKKPTETVGLDVVLG